MATATLAQELDYAAVDFDQLHRDYKPMLKIVEQLIGLVPNCDPYLEIWPTGFQTYNLLVPNLLNIPLSVTGHGAPKDLVGLGMYVSSRAAECMYCSAHTCSYAIRRGASEAAVTGNYNDVEASVASVAESLGRVPADLTHAQVAELERHLGRNDAEWVVHGIALMGFLNKFMDAMGIELEAASIADVQELIEPTGWTTGKHQWTDDLDVSSNGGIPQDSMRTYFKVLRAAPAAVRLEGRWTKGISGRIGPALTTLEERVGHAFPIFASLQHKRVVKSIATVLVHNLDRERTRVGLAAKCMTALVYARTVGDEVLVADAVQLATELVPELDPDVLVDVGHFAVSPNESAEIPRGITRTEAATLILAKAASPSPSEVNEITISTVTEHLDAEQIVEVVVWLSILQMLHRLYAFYDARLGIT